MNWKALKGMKKKRKLAERKLLSHCCLFPVGLCVCICTRKCKYTCFSIPTVQKSAPPPPAVSGWYQPVLEVFALESRTVSWGEGVFQFRGCSSLHTALGEIRVNIWITLLLMQEPVHYSFKGWPSFSLLSFHPLGHSGDPWSLSLSLPSLGAQNPSRQLEFDKTQLPPLLAPLLFTLALYSVPGTGSSHSVYSSQVVGYVPCSPGVLASHPTSI